MMNILLPTDFSENSRNTIRYALDFFVDIPVNFYFLHSSGKDVHLKEEEPIFLNGNTAVKMVFQDARKKLDEEIEASKIYSKTIAHNFHPIFENTLLVESIRKQLEEKQIDYILMGTKGASKKNRNEIGSNTSEVITKVKCPLLVIPENAKVNSIKNIAFITDYNCLYRNRIISSLLEILNLQKAALRMLHIRSQNSSLSATQTDNKGFLHYFFKDTKHSFHFLENKNVESGIQDFVEIWEIDMFAIVAKNLNLIQRLLFKPTVHPLNYQSKVPFLILHE